MPESTANLNATEEQIKNIIKENLKVKTVTDKEFIHGQDGYMGYTAIVTRTTVFFGDEKISEYESIKSIY